MSIVKVDSFACRKINIEAELLMEKKNRFILICFMLYHLTTLELIRRVLLHLA
jgi:hypothetical protein